MIQQRILLGIFASFALAAPAGAQTIDPAVLAQRLQPHRVIYSLRVANIGTTSGVVDARGAISYEFAEACDGWNTKHTFRLGITRSEATEKVVITDYTSWEAKDGLSFNFTSRTRTDGQETENRSGRATLDRRGGSGRAIVEGKGQRRDLVIPAGTTFPTWHTLVVLAAAKSGDTVVWRTLFDGSGDGKISGVHVGVQGSEAPGNAEPAALMAHIGWRFRAAYYDPSQPDKERPTYRVAMTVNEAGVTTAMQLDYDDFVLEAKIERIEALPKPSCR
jgi:hypothetical protein